MMRAIVVAILTAGWLVLAAAPASAHATLISTTPANGEHLATAPREVVFRFSERITPARDGFTVLDGQGRSVGPVAAVAGEQDTLRMPLPSLRDGAYSVTWRVVSADSHPVHGAFVFSVGAARAAPVVDAGAQAGADPLVGMAFWLLRWLSYLSIALLVGSAFFVAYCWPAGREYGRVRLTRHIAWWTAVGSAVGSLLLQGANVAGTSLATAVDPALLGDTLGTTFGVLLVVRLGALAAMRFLPDRPVPVLAAGAVLAVTWSGAGHDGVGDGWGLALAADSLHLLAMSVWLGGLAVLAGFVLAGMRPEVSTVASRFSRVATVSVGVLAASGVVMALRDVNLSAALDGSGYVRLLLFKLAAFGLLLCAAAASRSLVRGLVVGTRPTRSEAAAHRLVVSRLRWSVGGETAIAVVVLGLTAALVSTSPADTTLRPTTVAAQTGPYLGSLGLSSGGDVQVWVDPAVAGDNQVAVNVRDDRGVNRDVPEVTVSLSLPSGGVGSVPVPLVRTSAGQYVAQQMTIPSAGLWRLDVTVRTTGFDETTVQADVRVR